MYKIFLTLFFSVALSAEIVSGVAMVVKGEAVTLYDIQEEMRLSKVNIEVAKNTLVRKKLEEVEIKERKINISSGEVYDDIKAMATRNSMNVSDFYEAVRSSNGLTSTEFKAKTKEKLLSQKLYSAIAYKSITEPTDTEAKEYFELHKENFSHPSSFDVVIYTSKSKSRLKEKMANPMLNAPDIQMDVQLLEYDKISPELAKFLTKAKLNTFTPVVPNGKKAFMTFYMKNIKTVEEDGYEKVKDQIVTMIMGDKREQVLSDYFARLKTNADIKMIRMPK